MLRLRWLLPCVWSLLACGGGADSASGDAAATGGGGGAVASDVGSGAAGADVLGGAGDAGLGGTPLSPECTLDGDCPGGARCAADGTCRPACRSDFECGTSSRCVRDAGYCEPLQACGPDLVCEAGSACNCHGVCEPAGNGAPCRSDLQCPVEAYCDGCSGLCKPRVPPCGRCGGDGSECERPTDRCVPLGPAGVPTCLRGCVGQATCEALGPGFECRDSGAGEMLCVPTSGQCASEAACESDASCPDRQWCNERGLCQPGCDRDTACPNGQLCVNLRCVEPCGAEVPCPPPAECQPDGRCAVPGGCLSSADCPERETHCDQDAHLCVPGCERDVDCLSASEECVDGRCRPRGCIGNYKCAFSEVCDLATGQCAPAGGRHCESPCDPMDDMACGGAGNRCLSLQDRDGNALGDFCFEACQAAPNECPQGYQCVDISMESGGMGMPGEPPPEPERLCIRRCDQEPIQ